ncbi:2-phosphosulfolactate phosphatase [Reinekea blandensis]|nr:2-phosphosulfolactate phosphatase [Reinekea blandensis]
MKQSLFDVRCEWGEHGVTKLSDECDVVIIVDVLSFSTCVSLACERGARVYPGQPGDPDSAAYAESLGARLAVKRSQWRPDSGALCLSPVSMQSLQRHERLVLPSPNGAVLSQMAGHTPVIAGCLRNARAVAAAAMHLGSTIGVIPAGERWEDGTLRPAWEDLVGAGAIINELDGERSPEAAVAEMAYLSVVGEVSSRMLKTVSGRELVERGFKEDVLMACEENVDNGAPRLVDGAFLAP